MKMYFYNDNRKFGEDPSEKDFLVEIQEGDNINIYDTMEYKGKVYRMVSRSCTKDWCLVEEVDYDAYGEPEEETWEEDRIKCPYCGYIEEDVCDYYESKEFKCPRCEQTSQLEVDYTVTFTATPTEEMKRPQKIK